jgi:hypothetical protein
MAAAVVLYFRFNFRFHVSNLQWHVLWKFGDNLIISNETAAFYVKFKTLAAILDFGQYFRFCHFLIGHGTMNLCFKYHQNRSIHEKVVALFVSVYSGNALSSPIKRALWGSLSQSLFLINVTPKRHFIVWTRVVWAINRQIGPVVQSTKTQKKQFSHKMDLPQSLPLLTDLNQILQMSLYPGSDYNCRIWLMSFNRFGSCGVKIVGILFDHI